MKRIILFFFGVLSYCLSTAQPCIPYTAPYFTDFETDTVAQVPLCWSEYTTSSESRARVGGLNGSVSGSQYLQLYNGLSFSTGVAMAISPEFSDMTNEGRWIRFYAQTSNIAITLVVGTMSSPSAVSALNPLDTIVFNRAGVYQEYSVLLDSASGYNGTDKYIYFLHGGQVSSEYINIDDFHYEDIPPCPKPTNVFMQSSTDSSVTFSFFSENNNFDYELGPPGFVQGSGVTGSGTNPLTIDSLDSQTTYDVYIRANCSSGGNGTSLWTGPFTFTVSCTGALSGTYTIDRNIPTGNGNFSSFAEAALALDVCGISAPVVFNVKEGNYDDQMLLDGIPGSNSTNTVVFQADPSNTQPVNLSYASTSSSDNYVIAFGDASYVTIQGLNLEAIGTGDYGRVIDLFGSGENITIQNNTLTGLTGLSFNLSFIAFEQAVILNRSGIDNLNIRNNTINFGSGINAQNATGKNFYVDSNIIEASFYYGVTVEGSDSFYVRNNIIHPLNNGDNTIALEFRDCGTFEITANEVLIEAPSGRNCFGMGISSCEGEPGDPILIANNMISVLDNVGRANGMVVTFSGGLEIVHNSILLDASNANDGRGILLEFMTSSGGSTRVLNNNIGNIAGGVAMEISSADSGAIGEADYNNLYATGVNIAAWEGVLAADLSAWTVLSGRDSNSVSGNPLFLSRDDLHAQSPILKGTATPIVYISEDIDGEARSATAPDIGADEFVLSGCYPSIALTALSVYADSATFNWKPGAGISYIIEYGSPGYEAGTGVQISGISDTVYTISGLDPHMVYDVYVRDYCGGGDTSIWFGPITIETDCESRLSGTYTIDQSQPTGGSNYKSFQEVIAALNGCGVSGPVVFNISPGTYFENIFLKEITGTGPVNTVTFDGGKAEDVMITFTSVADTPTVYLAGADYVTFRNMTINNYGTSDAWGVLLQESADHNTVDSCIILMEIGSSSDVIGVLTSSSLSGESDGNNAHYLTVSNSTFIGGESGVTLEGGASREEMNKGHRISNNIFRYQDDHAIDGDGISDVVIENNDIDSLMNSGADAINIIDVDHYTIMGNKVISQDRGIYLNDGNEDIDTNIRSLVKNNMVISHSGYGIYLNDFEETDVFHNSASGFPGMLINDQVNVTIKNNIFYSSSDFAFESSDELGAGDTIDYNLYYSDNVELIEIDSDAYSNLIAWQAADVSRNINSLEGNPAFISASEDLHITDSSFAIDAADVSVGISVDIDGDIRPALGSQFVDIGADEFVKCSLPSDAELLFLGCDSAVIDWTSAASGSFSVIEYGTSGFERESGTYVFGPSPFTLHGLLPGVIYDIYISDTCGTDTTAAIGPLSFTTSSAPIEANFTYNIQPPSVSTITVDFDASTSIGAESFDWNFGDGSTGSGSTASHSYTIDGSYTVTLIVTGKCGRDTTTGNLTVEGIGLRDNIINRSLKIFPNPFFNEIQLSFQADGLEDIEINILDVSGKVVFVQEISSTNNLVTSKINLEELAKGTYLLQIKEGNIKAIRRIVKQ